MSKQKTQHALVPRLRFPEFRDTQTWVYKPLGMLTDPITEQVGDSDCVPYTVTSGEGLISQDEKYGRTIAGKSLKNYYRLQRDDFAFNKSATKAFPQGYIARFLGNECAAVPNSIFTCFRITDEKVDAAYLDYLFQGNLHGRWLKDYITVGARAHGALNISDDDLYALPVPLPAGDEALSEQQKIADFLSSLDDLIVAEGRKLEALRDHKKGLMQQLFPHEGETLPRFRFPEFRNAPEWEKGLLNNVVKSVKTGKLDANAMTEDGEYRFYTCAKNYYKIDKYAFEGEALLIAGNGAYLGYIHHYIGKFNAYQRTYVLQDFDINVMFLKFFLDRNLPSRINLEKKDGNTPYIVLATITDMPILIPKDIAEQEKIADCLASLDARIAAQAEKLDALRSHKRGLMQQLFPSPEENEA